jgi:hypothetical protein
MINSYLLLYSSVFSLVYQVFILMHNRYEASLEPVMRSAFEEVVGAPPKIDRKEPDKVLLQDAFDDDDPFGPVTTDDLDELLADLDVGYEHRLAAFRALKFA